MLRNSVSLLHIPQTVRASMNMTINSRHKFPSREVLIWRYEVERLMTDVEKKVFAERFYTSLDIPSPRFY